MFNVCTAMSLGERVRHYRSRLGWTLEILSERSGVDIGTISALEVRKSDRSRYAPQLAAALGLSVEQLLDASRDWLAQPGQTTQAATTLVARESTARYEAWPFSDIDPHLVRKLAPVQLAQLQGALLLAAAQLGVEIRKRAAA